MLNLDEIRYNLQTLYLKRGIRAKVEEAPREQFPTEKSPDVIRVMPSLPQVYAYDASFSATAPLPVTVDLQADWFEKSFRKLRIWHGYCKEWHIVYFAIERRYLEDLEI